MFLLLPLFLVSEEFEVFLPTESVKKSFYLSRIQIEKPPLDWRYLDELRSVLAFDLDVGGFVSLASCQESMDERLASSSLKEKFSPLVWQPICYVLSLEIEQDRLFAILYDVEQDAIKRYPEIPLSWNLKDDRFPLHVLSDQIHQDLFKIRGIASKHILYAQRTTDLFDTERKSEVWIADSDGANERQLTFENGYCLFPLFFPSSKQGEFLYASYKEGQSKIYISSFSEGKGESLISLRGNQTLPAISPQGNLVAFISDVAGRPDLFLQRLGANGKPLGKARQLFTAPRATEASSTFSPDGKEIAFVSDKDGPPRIYAMKIPDPKEMKKAKLRLLTTRCRENTSPCWSPDGKKLAYSGKIDGIRQIWLYDFETQEEIQLTTGSEMKENPSFAPDSLHLVYNTEGEDSCELFLLDIREKRSIQISKGLGQKRFPCWENRH